MFSKLFGKDIVDVVDQFLSDEFNRLSLEEKDRVLFEIHGIASNDDPEDLEQYFSDLQRYLCQIPEKNAFEAAKYYITDYIKSIRLMFLRSVRFDAKTAAEKLVNHFEMKQLLFGRGEILARDIRYSDLCDGDIKILETGFMQVLPIRDDTGRPIMFVRPGLKTHELPFQDHATRAMWYMLSTTLQDEKAQKNGIVIVLDAKHECLDADIRFMKIFHEACEALPIRIMGIHFCSDDPAVRTLMAFSTLHVMSREMRLHFRPHIFKDSKEIIFGLRMYGIPITKEYLKPNTNANVAWHREWLENIKWREQVSMNSLAGVIVPRKFDVLFGRRRNSREHTGNLRCALLVEMHMEQYEKASRHEKTMIAERIVSMVEESLGRFLKFEFKKGWVGVSRQQAREKVSQFFRFQRSRKVGNADRTSCIDDNNPTAEKTKTTC